MACQLKGRALWDTADPRVTDEVEIFVVTSRPKTFYLILFIVVDIFYLTKAM